MARKIERSPGTAAAPAITATKMAASTHAAAPSPMAPRYPDAGHRIIEAQRLGPVNRPRELGRAVGLELLAKGAADIIERSRVM